MPAPHVIRHTVFLLLLLLCATFCGCGGGGGGSAQSGTLYDPATLYAGTPTQAVVTSANAESIAMNAYAGGGLGVGLGTIGRASKTAARPTAEALPMRQLVQSLKLATRRLNVPRRAAQMRSAAASGGKAVAMRQTTFDSSGDNGGTASYTLEINDSSGSFYGTVNYTSYTSRGATINGSCDLLGSFDLTRQELSQLTLSFKSLSMSDADHSYLLGGTVSWVYQYATYSDTVSMNLVLKDNALSKTYWYKDYRITTVYGEGAVTHTVSGRYFDHDHGYVDVVTSTPLVASYGSAWPSRGALQVNAANGEWVRIGFQPTLYTVEADTNADGTADWQVQRDSNAAPAPPNAPPVAQAGADRTVAQGATVQLDGSASSDADGDTLSYSWSFASVPAGATPPSLTGSNSATSSFTPTVAGSYQLQLTVYDGSSSASDAVTVTVTQAAAQQLNGVQQTWQYGTYGSYIGAAGLIPSDLDGDGVPEVIATASTGGSGSNVFYVVRKNAAGGFEQVWRSESYGVSIVRMLLADVNADGKKDVVLAFDDGTIRCYDGPTLQELPGLTVAPALRDFAIADVDGDGHQEMVTTDGSAVRIYSVETGMLKWSKSGCGGNSIAVGNVDATPQQEIVTTGFGGRGYVIDGTTGTVKWEYANGFGARVRLGDLDGDGKQEIIAASAWYKITIFDAALKSPVWEIATRLDIASVAVVDTDGDGIPEILYGDNQWGRVHAIDAQTHQERWSVYNPSSGVDGLGFADVDQDGKKELLWSGGGNTSGADFLYVADAATGTIKWQNHDFYGLSVLATGALNNDGTNQLLMVTTNSNSFDDRGLIHVFNTPTMALSYQQALGLSDWMGSHRALKIGDVDGDGRTEFVLSTSNTYDGFLRVYDGATRTVKGKTAGYEGNFFSALALGDVDGDGKTEIVAGQGREHTGALGVYLMVFDGATLQEKWRSVDLGTYWGSVYDLKLADLDRDGRQDIICSVAGSQLVVYDGVTHVQKLAIPAPARALAVADLDGDGFPEILLGRSDGNIDVYDGVSFTVKRTVPTLSTSPVDALQLADLDGSGSRDWIVASGGKLSILKGESLYWRSGYLGNNLGRGNNLEVKDTDRDGRPNVFVGSDTVLYRFKYLGGSGGV